MKEISLYKLYLLKESMEEEHLINESAYIKVCNKIYEKELLLESDGGAGTSATGGPSVGGMGDVVNSQPSGLAGATIGTSWASGGGKLGSGDVSSPYNPSGSNRMQQKIPVMGYNHGSRTGKKSRTKKLDLKALKNVMSKRQDYTAGEGEVKKAPKVMNFQDFIKNDFTTVKK